MGCPDSFTFDYTEKHPEPKSGQNLIPDKRGCTVSGQGEINPYSSSALFLISVPNP